MLLRMNEVQLRNFIDKIEVDILEGCWDWTACKLDGSHGGFRLNGKIEYAHRVSYMYWKTTIPENMQIDHLCRNRSCVNPQHLETVAPKENILRGIGIAAINAKKTHCIHGHELIPKNTYIRKNGNRQCILCHKILHKKYQH